MKLELSSSPSITSRFSEKNPPTAASVGRGFSAKSPSYWLRTISTSRCERSSITRSVSSGIPLKWA